MRKEPLIRQALSEDQVLARVRAGDREAYAELVHRHAPIAVRTAALLGADAEDVVQEAFVKAYAALGGFRDGAPFRPWLLRIVANETRKPVGGAGSGGLALLLTAFVGALTGAGVVLAAPRLRHPSPSAPAATAADDTHAMEFELLPHDRTESSEES